MKYESNGKNPKKTRKIYTYWNFTKGFRNFKCNKTLIVIFTKGLYLGYFNLNHKCA